LLREYYEQAFKQIEPQVIAEQQSLLTQLRQTIIAGTDTYLGQHKEFSLQNLSPIIFTPSIFLQNHNNAYIHEIHRSLFDFCAYEPFILLIGRQKILEPEKQREVGRAPTLPASTASEPEQWSRLFAALADPSRLRLLHLLARQPYYQQELAAALGVSGATVSHHLTLLMHSGLVRLERHAHRTYIVLQNEALAQQLQASQQYLLGDTAPAKGTDPAC
jgi:predicted transcriptional regulator